MRVLFLFLLLIDGVKRADYNGTRKTYRREGVFSFRFYPLHYALTYSLNLNIVKARLKARFFADLKLIVNLLCVSLLVLHNVVVNFGLSKNVVNPAKSDKVKKKV